MTETSDHERISRKAHELWEAEGRPHGRDQDHWDQAREIIAVEDSQGDALLPRESGAETPVEEPEEALRNLADMPNLTDQGENLLTSTDREPPLTATPAVRKGRKPKMEVPTSDQPGVPAKGRRSAKDDKAASPKRSARPTSAEAPETVEPKAAVVPKVAAAADETATGEFTPRGGRRRKAE